MDFISQNNSVVQELSSFDLGITYDSIYAEDKHLTPYEMVSSIVTEFPVHSMLDLGDKIITNSKKHLTIYSLEKEFGLLSQRTFDTHLSCVLSHDPTE